MAAKIDTVVVLMMENRSFDHMLGMRPGVNGILADGKVKPGLSNVDRQSHKTFPVGSQASFVIPTKDIDSKGFGGPEHSLPATTLQLYGAEDPPNASALAQPAPLSGFVDSYRKTLAGGPKNTNPTYDELAEPVSTFRQADLPVLNALADDFVLCDNWYSEVPGPTQPNRLYVHAGTSAGFAHNVWKRPFDVMTIYDELERVGHTWAFYRHDMCDSDSFSRLKGRVDRIRTFDRFKADADAGKLANYSFICPRFNDQDGEFANSQHAPYDVRLGEALIANVYNALRGSPQWGRSLLIVTYDECGGYYDHVAPPTAGVDNPDGLTSPTAEDRDLAARNPKNSYLLQPKNSFDFSRLGVRVPALLVSPWVQAGGVCSDKLQHTSILATMRDLFGVSSLTRRDAQAASFSSQFTAAVRTDAPAMIPVPVVLAPTAADMALPPTKMQVEMFPRIANLDGHPDSGFVPPMPPTRQALSDYLDERRAAHNLFHTERPQFHVSADEHGEIRWNLVNRQGQTVAKSRRPFASFDEANAAVSRAMARAPVPLSTAP